MQTWWIPHLFFRPGRSGVAHHDGEVREAIRGAGWCLDGNEVEGAIGARVGVLAAKKNEPRGAARVKKPMVGDYEMHKLSKKSDFALEDSGTLRCHQTWLGNSRNGGVNGNINEQYRDVPLNHV